LNVCRVTEHGITGSRNIIHKLAVQLLLRVYWGYRIGIDDSNYAPFLII
jgi:hypothetical protein